MVEREEKSLLALFCKMNVSYPDIHDEIIRGGYKLSRGTLERIVRGDEMHEPKPETVEAMWFGFKKAAEKWRPDMVAEINTFFDKHYGDGDTDA